MAGKLDTLLQNINSIVDTGINNYSRIVQTVGTKGQAVFSGPIITPQSIDRAQKVGAVILVALLVVVFGVLVFGKKRG